MRIISGFLKGKKIDMMNFKLKTIVQYATE